MDLDKEELEATRNINKNYNTDLKNIIIELCKITKAINASYLLNNNAFLIKGNRDLGNLLEDTIYYLEKQDKIINEIADEMADIDYDYMCGNWCGNETGCAGEERAMCIKKYFIKKVEE